MKMNFSKYCQLVVMINYADKTTDATSNYRSAATASTAPSHR